MKDLIQKFYHIRTKQMRLREVLSIKSGSDYKHLGEGSIPVYGSGGIISYVDTTAYVKPSVLIPRKGSLHNLFYVEGPFWTVDTIFYTEINTKIVDPKYVFYFLQSQHLERLNMSGSVPTLTKSTLDKIEIFVPPLEIQQEIVRVLDCFTELNFALEEEMTLRKKQYKYFLYKLILNNPLTKPMLLGDVGSVLMCKRVLKAETTNSGDVPFYKIGTFGKEANAFISTELFKDYKEKYPYPKEGEVLISSAGTIGRVVVFNGDPAYFQDSNIVWICNDESKVFNSYLYYCYQLNPWTASEGGTISRLYNDDIRRAVINVPPISEQKRIVSILNLFCIYCDRLTTEISLRNKQYEYYRDKIFNISRLITKNNIPRFRGS